MDENGIKKVVNKVLDDRELDNLYNPPRTPFHTHNGIDSPTLTTPRIGSLVLFGSGTSITTGDGVAAVPIPAEMSGMQLTDVMANVYTVGSGATMTLQVRRSRGGVDVDMLSSALSMGLVYYVNNPVVNPSYSDIQTGDKIYVDVDTVHTVPAKGLSVALTFS